MNSSEIIAQESGFEIRRAGAEVYFLYRRTFAVALAASITGGLALFAGVWCVVLPMAFHQPGDNSALIAAVVLGLLFAVFLTAAILCLKAYLRRRAQPWDQVKGILVAALDQGVLREREGRDLCPLAEVRSRVGIDPLDHSRGLMRVIALSWPSGKVRVFKTSSGQEAQRVQQELARIGIMPAK